MTTVIISGGIGSGKTTVCRMLEADFGWPVYFADIRVKELYISHPTLLMDIENLLSECFRDENGEFCPNALGARIFSDANALEAVEKLVFPVLAEDFLYWKSVHSDKEYAVLESATILEKEELLGLGDYIAIVDAELPVRIARAIERDAVSIDSVKARVENQQLMNKVSDGELPPFVDYVIMNNGSIDDLRKNVGKFVDHIVKTKML